MQASTGRAFHADFDTCENPRHGDGIGEPGKQASEKDTAHRVVVKTVQLIRHVSAAPLADVWTQVTPELIGVI